MSTRRPARALRSWGGIALFVLFPALAGGGEPIKIGLLARDLGSVPGGYRRGAEMAVAEVNAREGKQGLRLLLVLRSGSDGPEAREGSRRLLEEEGVRFLLGAVGRELIPQIALLAQKRRVPFLAFPPEFLESPSMAGSLPNLFWISPAPEAFQRAAVRMAAQLPQRRIFLFARDSEAARSSVKYFREEIRRSKPAAELVGEAFLSGKEMDLASWAQSILSAGAELCLSHLGREVWPPFVRAARKEGYFRKVVHFEMASGQVESLLSLKKDLPEGIWGATAFPFWALPGKEAREFLGKYRAGSDSYPGQEALGGYVSIYALVEALKRAGSQEPEKVMGALEGLSLPTPAGTLTIRRSDRRALWPIWCGTSQFTPDYPFPVLGNLQAFGPDSFTP